MAKLCSTPEFNFKFLTINVDLKLFPAYTCGCGLPIARLPIARLLGVSECPSIDTFTLTA